ncbi:MAG TPA: C13 family peptidase [Solimonas sp.]|nr:C13 family peptidase [Solimonas sp.]
MPWSEETQPELPSEPAPAAAATESETPGTLLRSLGAGLRLGLLGRPRIDNLPLSAHAFWLLALLQLALNFTLAWLTAETPRRFDREGYTSEGVGIAVNLLLAYVIASGLSAPALLWRAAVLLGGAGLLLSVMGTLVQEYLFPQWLSDDDRWAWGVWALFMAWWLAIFSRLSQLLQPASTPRQRGGIALLSLLLLGLSAWFVPHHELWTRDYAADYESEEQNRPPSLIAEEVFGAQPQRLQAALDAVLPGTAGKPELYFVAFGPYGDQDVFRKEAEYSTRLFRDRFGAAGRTLTLVTHRDSLGQQPLATVSNLGTALKELGRRMNRDEDILFLFLTSHGSQEGELSVQLEDLSFTPLTPETLARLLQESQIRWKVLVVSSCYSGSFIEKLKDEQTLLITAARHDRVSFGCSDEAEFTEFGRAYFEQALNQTRSFTEAFSLARKRVEQREREEKETPSEPQIIIGGQIEAKLGKWRETLAIDP